MSGGGAFKLNAVGRTDGATIEAGLVGERITSTVSTGGAVPLTSGAFAQVTSITLTPGRWSISGIVGIRPDASASLTRESAGVNTSGGASSTTGNTVRHSAVVPGTNADIFLTARTRRVSVTANTVYYLVACADFTAGNVAAYGVIEATREATA